ncbi:hypothetical protein QJQ45_011927 [Haematococcus lacustris]|nr:hypothetical protein QJQ45_011927 [Haematococcus lacustris]
MKVAVGRAQAEVQRLRGVEQSLLGTVDGLQGDLDDLQAAHQRLQGEHTALQQVASRAAATNHSLRAARRRLQGQAQMALPHLFAALGSSDQATRMEVAVDVVYHVEVQLLPPEDGQQLQLQQQEDPHGTWRQYASDIRAMAVNGDPGSPALPLHLEQYYLASPISNAPVESLLQLLKHGGGRYMELPALLQLMSLRTCKEAMKTVDVHDLQQRMGQLRAEVRRKEGAAAAEQRIITTPTGGGIGLCFCPGKRVTRGGVRHERSMQRDLLRLRDTFQISTVACLLNAAELRSFGIRDYAADLAAAGLQTLGLPIIEMGAPECMEEAAMFIEGLALGVSRGDRIAVHCR